MVDISEKNFEATIEATLLAGGPDAAPGDLVAVREAPGDFTPGSYLRRAPGAVRPHPLLDPRRRPGLRLRHPAQGMGEVQEAARGERAPTGC